MNNLSPNQIFDLAYLCGGIVGCFFGWWTRSLVWGMAIMVGGALFNFLVFRGAQL